MAKLENLPDNFVPNGVAPAAQAGLTALPDNFVPNGVAPNQGAAAKPDSLSRQASDFVANVATGVLKVPGAIGGIPQMAAHTGDWVAAQAKNAWYGARPDGSFRTGADLDKDNLAATHLPTADDINKFVQNPPHPHALDFLFNRVDDPSQPAQFYEPKSVAGKLTQAGVTGFLSGSGGWADRARIAAGAMGADASDQIAPDNPALEAAAAVVAHTGTGAAMRGAKAARGVGGDATRQLFRPGNQGRVEAGRVLADVDNTAPGLADPSASEIQGAHETVRAATDAIGPGLPDFLAGGQVRAVLQARTNELKAQRSAATDRAFEAFRAQPPLPATELAPFMRSPSFRKAIGAANGAVLDEGHEPLTKYFDFSTDPDTAGHLLGEAIPTDVLHRVKSHLGDAVKSAAPGSQAERTATMLNNRFGGFLDDAYPASGDFPGYGAIRKEYAAASRPLDPMTFGPVEKVLDTEKQYGQSRYTFPDERVPDLFLRSNATRADLGQLVEAHGGDKAAALGALEQHLAGVAQRAVQPNGTVDVAAFDKAMKPYRQSLGNLSVWFPELSRKFGTAKAAQASLDRLASQRTIADAVEGGALRDAGGAVTGASMSNWLRANRNVLARTQDPSAVMRLQNIAGVLARAQPGELADALKSEIAPAALGTAFGGLEGGVLATLLHKATKATLGNVDAARQAAFSAALERAVLDPAYAKALSTSVAKVRPVISPVRELVRATLATPVAVGAGHD